jgi:hypothetical protein
MNHRGTILDVTPLGLCMRTVVPCKIGARLLLAVPINSRIRRLAGFVRYRQEADKDGTPIYTYGIQLDAPDAETCAILEQM